MDKKTKILSTCPAVCIILIFVLQAVILSLFVPLWQGNDEVSHYAYIQYIGEHHTLPTKENVLSAEVVETLLSIPVSHYVANVFGGWSYNTKLVSFDEYNSFPEAVRLAREKNLKSINHVKRRESGINNILYADGVVPVETQLFYIRDFILKQNPDGTISTRIWEAQQQPLYYLIMSIFYKAFSAFNTVDLVHVLRIITALLFLPTLYFVFKFFRLFFESTVSYLITFSLLFIPQLWLLITHISNDSLAITFGSMFFYLLARWILDSTPSNNTLMLATLITAGIASITKMHLVILIGLWIITAIYKKYKNQLDRRSMALPSLILILFFLLILAKNLHFGSVIGMYRSEKSLQTYITAMQGFRYDILMQYVYYDFVGNLGWINESFPEPVFERLPQFFVGVIFILLIINGIIRKQKLSPSSLFLTLLFIFGFSILSLLIYLANLLYSVNHPTGGYIFYGGWYFWPFLIPILYILFGPLIMVHPNPNHSRWTLSTILIGLSIFHLGTLLKLYEYYYLIRL